MYIWVAVASASRNRTASSLFSVAGVVMCVCQRPEAVTFDANSGKDKSDPEPILTKHDPFVLRCLGPFERLLVCGVLGGANTLDLLCQSHAQVAETSEPEVHVAARSEILQFQFCGPDASCLEIRQVLHSLHRSAELGAPLGELPAWPGWQRLSSGNVAELGPGFFNEGTRVVLLSKTGRSAAGGGL